MAIKQRFCVFHPDRPAIGVCVITQQAICGECSTRYEGVNYSRQGLQILQQRRATAAARAGLGRRLARIPVALCATLLLMYLIYLGFSFWTGQIMNLLFPGRS